jgi:hypothetical protein
MHDPSPSQSLRRFGCFAGTFRPSCRQIRSTRLWFTPGDKTWNPTLLVAERQVDGADGRDWGGRVDLLFGTDYLFTTAHDRGGGQA